jgi:ABC-type multidrug transport system fused ATPase/permease subunit
MRGPMHRMIQVAEEKPKNRKQVVGRMVGLLRPYLRQVMAAMGMVIIAAAAQGAGPYLIGVAVDEMITTGNTAGLAQTMLALGITYLVQLAATRYQIIFMAKAGQQLLADLRQRVFEKLESLSLQFLESQQAGDLMSRLVNDIDALNSFFLTGIDPDDWITVCAAWHWYRHDAAQLAARFDRAGDGSAALFGDQRLFPLGAPCLSKDARNIG